MVQKGSPALYKLLELWRDRLVHRSRIGKRKLDVAFVRRKLDGKLQDLGEAWSELARSGRVAVPEELAGLVAEVRKLEKEIEEKGAEIAKLEEEDVAAQPKE